MACMPNIRCNSPQTNCVLFGFFSLILIQAEYAGLAQESSSLMGLGETGWNTLTNLSPSPSCSSLRVVSVPCQKGKPDLMSKPDLMGKPPCPNGQPGMERFQHFWLYGYFLHLNFTVEFLFPKMVGEGSNMYIIFGREVTCKHAHGGAVIVQTLH